jgi:hypothetical protein
MDPLADALFGEDKKWAKFPVNFIIVLISIGSAIYFCKQEDYGSATAVAFLGMALRSGYRAGAATYIGFLVGGSRPSRWASCLSRRFNNCLGRMESPIDSLVWAQSVQ